MTRVTVVINAGAVVGVVRGDVEPAVHRAAERTRDRVRQNITIANRVNTGRMQKTIYVQALSPTTGPRYEVGSDLFYTIYQEEGVAGPITPKRAKVLRFRPKGGTGFVFAHSTRGFPGAFMFRKAWQALTLADFLP